MQSVPPARHPVFSHKNHVFQLPASQTHSMQKSGFAARSDYKRYLFDAWADACYHDEKSKLRILAAAEDGGRTDSAS
jgi:hypothetical protein